MRCIGRLINDDVNAERLTNSQESKGRERIPLDNTRELFP